MERITTDRIFETSDLYLASYLLTRGLELWATDPRDPGRMVFVLTPRPEAKDLEAYAEGRAVADLAPFGRAFRTLKREIWRWRDGR